jgi:hypothetical protein
MAFLKARCSVNRSSLALFLSAWSIACTQGQTIDEYRVKAAFLYNFTKFVQWPPEAFRSPSDPIAICVVGRDPFAGSLEQVVNGKTISGRAFVIVHADGAQQASQCQIVFFSSSESKGSRSLLKGLKKGGRLTVGETENFTAEGGVVNFTLGNGRVGFEINVTAAAEERLQISSKLLSLAHIVKR